MTDKWQLYSQTGVDGPEYGVRIRPGYTVVGFQKEDAEAIVAWQNASIQPARREIEANQRALDLQYQLTDSEAEVERLRSEKPFLSEETIRPSINLVECEKTKEIWRLKEEIADKDARIKELESLNESLMENGNDLRSRCQIAEATCNKLTGALSESGKRQDKLEAAFLEDYLYIIEHRQCHYPGFGVTKEMREEARAALEELK